MTRVRSPSTSISGRKDAGMAWVEVGATTTVDIMSSSLLWSTTA
jgi:hypothetical protein